MPTKYLFCPLCFQKLDLHQSFYVSRPEERKRNAKPELRPIPQEINFEKLQRLIAEDETSNGDPKNGIFLAHKSCTCLNPFCRRNDTSVIDFGPASLKSNEGLIPDSDLKARHYEVGILKCINPKVTQMWFPAALLNVTNPSKQKPGCVVVLAGATGVGKTILALQSMHSDGFENTLNENKVSVSPVHFAYAPAPARFADCVNTIEMLLHPNEALDKWTQPGTTPDLGELRAVFYRSSLLPKEGTNVGEVADAWDEVKKVFRGRPKAYPSRWRTVIFYDAAGEHFEDENLQVIEELYDVTDNMAVVVEASSFLPCANEPNSSAYRRWDRILSTAWEHIDRIQQRSPGQQPRWSLVVTKVDQIKERIDGSLWETMEHFAERAIRSKSGVPDGRGDPLDLLWKLVGANASRNQRKLLQRLTAKAGRPRPEIFFVWTDGLDFNNGVRVLPGGGAGEVPKSYGLGKFIEWCLNEPLAVINFAASEVDTKDR